MLEVGDTGGQERIGSVHYSPTSFEVIYIYHFIQGVRIGCISSYILSLQDGTVLSVAVKACKIESEESHGDNFLEEARKLWSLFFTFA